MAQLSINWRKNYSNKFRNGFRRASMINPFLFQGPGILFYLPCIDKFRKKTKISAKIDAWKCNLVTFYEIMTDRLTILLATNQPTNKPTNQPTDQPTDKHDGSLGSCAVADFFFVRPGVMVSRVSHLAFFKKL